jgi:PTH1 family peptidyl-tRNA hydrolase
MEADLWIVVGLGNPGPRYEGNRHNIGFMVAEALYRRGRHLQWRSSTRFEAELAKGALGRHDVVLVKPQTFMNLSGRSVGPLARFYRVPPERLIVIHDDVDLEPGRLKVKAGGGDGGHKGIRSTAQELGAADFIRIRCGVGRPEVGEVTDYVLRDFTDGEREILEDEIKRAASAVTTVMNRGLREAMNRYNRPPAAKKVQKKEAPQTPGAADEQNPEEEAARSDTTS